MTPVSERPRVVIVGGGFGGLTAARAFRRSDVDVTVIDENNHHTFQPLLYQVATATLNPSDITAPIRHVLRYQKNASVLLAEVVDIDVANRNLTVDEGASRSRVVHYDYLVAAGSFAKSKVHAKLRIEGNEYVMKYGDVVEFRFNV